MSKPHDIPQDIWDKAYAALVLLMRGKLSEVPDRSVTGDTTIIARAIMSALPTGGRMDE